MCLSLSASGMAYCGPDIGGFAGKASPELYARWMQAGVLFPFMRTHYSHEETSEQEPWSFGPEVEAICRRAITLRYELMPTLYSAFAACAETAEPPMKALFLEHPDDAAHAHRLRRADLPRPRAHGRAGPRRGRRRPRGLLPRRRRRLDRLRDGRAPSGAGSRIVAAPLDTLPLFIRGGRVVAMDPPMHAHRRVRARDAAPARRARARARPRSPSTTASRTPSRPATATRCASTSSPATAG